MEIYFNRVFIFSDAKFGTFMKFTILILRFVSILSIDNTDTLEVIVENCCHVVLMAVIMIDLEETRLFVKRV